MVGKLMMKPVAIDPAYGIDVDAHRVIDESQCLDEPLLIIQGTMRDA